MPLFTELPARGGDGPWHVNYFRVFIQPRHKPMPKGPELMGLMPEVMHKHTATVGVDTSHRWAGQPTLMFRGVARVRPFALVGVAPLPLPVPLPKAIEKWGVPEGVRQWMVPQVHTDSVGLAVPPGPHSFMAQTLKREFETPDDQWIRQMLPSQTEASLGDFLRRIRDGLLQPPPGLLPLRDPIGEWQMRIVAGWLERAARALNGVEHVTAALADIAVAINQHHFLAGRRSFRMATATELGLTAADARAAGLPPSAIAPDVWVFETAAVERFSLPVFRLATDYAMGGDAQMLRPVWVEMCGKMAAHHGKQLGEVVAEQVEFGSGGAAAGSAMYGGIHRRHGPVLPG